MPQVQCLACGNDIWLDDSTYANYQGRVVCPDCKSHQEVVIQKKSLVTSNAIVDIYEPIRSILAWDIPTDMILDLAEAAVDLGVNSYKSCVVMCRRCVHALLLEKGVKDDPSLARMIEEAAGRGILTEELRTTASAVRFFGVTGAHPKDPLLRKVTKLQASIALEATKEILEHVYPLKQLEPEQLALGEQSGTGSNAP